MGRSINERFGGSYETWQKQKLSVFTDLRVCIPAIVRRFDTTTQTVSVQPCLREIIRDENLQERFEQLPLIEDVPLIMPKGGNFVLTMPVSAGDEILLFVSDVCIDSWWSNGDVQNIADKRRHDLSDCFAMCGTWSQPNRISNYSTNMIQLRHKDGTKTIDISETEINIKNGTQQIKMTNIYIDLIGTIKKNGVLL